MRIIDQNISLSAQHQSAFRHQQSEQTQRFIGGQLVQQQNKQFETSGFQSESFGLQKSSVNFTEDALQKNTINDKANQSNGVPMIGTRLPWDPRDENQRQLFESRSESAKTVDPDSALGRQLPENLRRMIEAVEAMIEQMTGKKTTLEIYGYQSASKADTDQTPGVTAPFKGRELPSTNNIQIRANQMNLQGTREEFFERYHESEQTRFNAQGSVTTADGRTIDFKMASQMQRQFYSETQVQIEKGFILQDPLVVNFGGEPATLTIDKVAFDLNSDGQVEEISFVGAGSGFLALDKNQDGLINNGNELFGTLSGNGFADLSQYDEDKNGWIDENDDVFSQLKVWHKTPQGLDELSGLLSLNIGAISLQHIETPFSLKTEANQTLGQVVSSGVFLSEDGKIGTIQQIDLAV